MSNVMYVMGVADVMVDISGIITILATLFLVLSCWQTGVSVAGDLLSFA